MTEPFLCNLGISERDQLTGPTIQNMPSKFNSADAQAIQIWNQVVIECTSERNDALTNWGNCIKEYVSNCVAQDVFPYLADPKLVNSSIFSKLQAQRQQLIDCLCLSKDLSKLIDTSVSKVSREVAFIDSGFFIRCSAKIRLSFFDVEDIAKSLGFVSSSLSNVEQFYKKDLGNGVCIALESNLDQPNHTNLCYELHQETLPYLANNYMPSQAELSKFILDIMYIPIIKMSSPTPFAQRLF